MLTGTRSPIRPFESGNRRRKRGGGRVPRRGRLFLIVALVLLIVLAAAVAVYASTPYGPSAEAQEALKSDDAVSVSQAEDWIRFEPRAADDAEKARQPGVIFYPGARVKPEAYAVFARDLAETGRRVFIMKMPFHFAFLGQNEAEKVRNEYPDEIFAIGGHSLGGPFAARYAAEHPEDIAGLFLLASYAESKGDLGGTQLPVLSIAASRDEVLNRESYEKGRDYLPADAQYETIEGGNHGQFGSYGEQRGDGRASISGEEQRKRTVELIAAWLDAMPAEVR